MSWNEEIFSMLGVFLAFLDYQECDTMNEFNNSQIKQSTEKTKESELAAWSNVSG